MAAHARARHSLFWWTFAGLVFLVSGPPRFHAQSADAWRPLTTIDLEAAHALIRDNHPGPVVALKDDAFQSALRTGISQAQTRLPHVTTYGGYEALLRGFAVSFGDKHIQFSPAVASRSVAFPGWIVARRGGAWIVVDEELRPGETSRKGQRLAGCDGVDVEPLAERRLGAFRAVWSVEAQRIAYSPWLLIDDDNPFLPRLKSCVFDRSGQLETVELAWRRIDRSRLEPRFSAAVKTGAAGFGVRQFAGGWWIGLQSLADAAKPVVDEVVKLTDTLRAARMVVLDLRGNSGGGSLYGRQIARAIYGASHVQAALAGGSSACTAVWRASEGNIAAVQSFLKQSGAARGPEFVKEFESVAAAMRATLARGGSLTGDPTCPPASAKIAAAPPPPSPFSGRMILLTDHVCFSSCLLVTDDFRRLGAQHVGEATDVTTRYMEVRSIRLPSGLGSFSTLQKVAIGIPPQIGPFIPHRRFDGDISDTAALEKWIASMGAKETDADPRVGATDDLIDALMSAYVISVHDRHKHPGAGS